MFKIPFGYIILKTISGLAFTEMTMLEKNIGAKCKITNHAHDMHTNWFMITWRRFVIYYLRKIVLSVQHIIMALYNVLLGSFFIWRKPREILSSKLTSRWFLAVKIMQTVSWTNLKEMQTTYSEAQIQRASFEQ